MDGKGKKKQGFKFPASSKYITPWRSPLNGGHDSNHPFSKVKFGSLQLHSEEAGSWWWCVIFPVEGLEGQAFIVESSWPIAYQLKHPRSHVLKTSNTCRFFFLFDTLVAFFWTTKFGIIWIYTPLSNSGKWRFRLGFRSLRMWNIILVVTSDCILGPGGGSSKVSFNTNPWGFCWCIFWISAK